jgi:hypothetical protein
MKLVDCPNTEGFWDDRTAVVEDAFVTDCINTGDMLPAKLLSPPYTAVIE